MAILNYTTSIAAGKSVGEIQETLAKHGARCIMVDYEQGLPSAIAFVLPVAQGNSSFRLPANVAGVQATLAKQFGPKSVKATFQQANRVGWRILKDWVEAQCAIIQAGMATVDEVFYPYLLNAAGVTVYEAYKDSDIKQLNP